MFVRQPKFTGLSRAEKDTARIEIGVDVAVADRAAVEELIHLGGAQRGRRIVDMIGANALAR